MCSYEPDIDQFWSKFNGDDQTISIPFDIEYIPLIAHIIH